MKYDADNDVITDHAEHRNPVEVLAEEFLDRRRRGEVASVQEYASSHPELASEIRGLFPAMLAMEKFRRNRLSSSSSRIDLQIEAPEQLGDYRIICEVGRGGMGVVYEAEQQSLGRRVAVKLFPRQVLSDSRQLKRFHSEARTAAGLHHTNIVPVFGVGQQDGLHYYVMQCIQGKGLDQFVQPAMTEPDPSVTKGNLTYTPPIAFSSTVTNITESDADSEVVTTTSVASDLSNAESEVQSSVADLLDFRTVADIGIQVSAALAYAHAHGVLHRDIKPGNLILDPQGTVWVTDFGLATLLESEERNDRAEVVGTLRFMAPEHLNGKQDARSDLYSLGVTLYELLTLRPAFSEQSKAKLINKIMKGDVVPATTLRPGIPPDLAAIVHKAMAGESAQRYSSAADLADDLRRFLDGRPVAARPIGISGRLWRWTRRNPIVATLSSALVVGAVLSFVMISSKWSEAVVQGARAEANLSLALESMDQILERFASSWMAHPIATGDADDPEAGFEPQLAVTDYNAAVLQNALRFYDRFARQNTTNPQLRRDTAKVHRRVGDIYQRLGQNTKAEQAYRRCLQILEAENASDNAAIVAERASTINQMGLGMFRSSRFAEAEGEFRRAKQMLLKTTHQNDAECRAERARTEHNLGQVLQLIRRYSEARRCHRDAVELLESLVEEHPEKADYRLSLARAYRTSSQGQRRKKADQLRSAGIAILEELVAEFPNVPDYQCELSEMLITRRFGSRDEQNLEHQQIETERAVELAKSLSVKYPPIPRYRALLARTLKEQAGILSRTASPAAADERFEESVLLYQGLVEDFSDVPVYGFFLAYSLREHAKNLRKLDRLSDAETALLDGITALKHYLSLRPESSFGNYGLAGMFEDLGEVLTDSGAHASAKAAFEEANEIRLLLGQPRG